MTKKKTSYAFETSLLKLLLDFKTVNLKVFYRWSLETVVCILAVLIEDLSLFSVQVLTTNDVVRWLQAHRFSILLLVHVDSDFTLHRVRMCSSYLSSLMLSSADTGVTYFRGTS